MFYLTGAGGLNCFMVSSSRQRIVRFKVSLCDKLIRVLGIFRTGPIRGPRATYFTGKYGTVFILLRK